MFRQITDDNIKNVVNMYAIFGNGSGPNDWKSAMLLPILKHKKDCTIVDFYRPIALTSAICERILLKPIVGWINEKQNINKYHCVSFPTRTVVRYSPLCTMILTRLRSKSLSLRLTSTLRLPTTQYGPMAWYIYWQKLASMVKLSYGSLIRYKTGK